MVPTGTIAIGVVSSRFSGEIDLSVPDLSAGPAPVLAVGFVNHGWTSGMAVGLALLVAIAIGVIYGLLFNRYGVPSFVITWLACCVLGPADQVLGKDGTINPAFTSDIVQFASQKFVPDAVALCPRPSLSVPRSSPSSRRAAGVRPGSRLCPVRRPRPHGTARPDSACCLHPRPGPRSQLYGP